MELPHYLCEPHHRSDDNFSLSYGFAVVLALASIDLGMLQLGSSRYHWASLT